MNARAALVGALLTALSMPVSAAGQTVVVFTIDVESNASFRLPDQVDATCEGVPCGLAEIARRLAARGWSGTFFLNVYEHRQWGEAAMARLAAGLRDAGQDVALHTHPDSAYDAARPGMFQYDLDAQTSIVRDGVRLLERWTGQPVVAHRAGAYGADARTLVALERNGIVIDSSLFWRHPTSRLDALGLPRNLPARRGQVVEIPVTVYERQTRPSLLGALARPVTVVRKIDADWLVNREEAASAIDASAAAGFPVVVVFLHSFSFMSPGASNAAPRLDRHALDMFTAIADHVASRGLKVVSMRDVAARLPPIVAADRDSVPVVAVAIDAPRYVWARVKGSSVPALPVAAGVTLLCAAGVMLRRRWMPA